MGNQYFVFQTLRSPWVHNIHSILVGEPFEGELRIAERNVETVQKEKSLSTVLSF